MQVKTRPIRFPRHVAVAYCTACHALFGKTLSVMAGEAHADGRWYGQFCTIFIDWLLRDPDHCANQLLYYRRLNRV